jgi:hypothetical protein
VIALRNRVRCRKGAGLAAGTAVLLSREATHPLATHPRDKMKLPHAEEAVVPQRKMELYLLNPSHPIGGSKAEFFMRFGFSREQWLHLAEALRRHARANSVASAVSDADGTTYLVEGPLETPSGRRPRLRTIWLVETGQLAPRFITAYPLPA